MARGSCLCGRARFETEGRLTPIQYCHCTRCRKATGGAFMAALAVKTDAFRWIDGAELIGSYTAPIREAPPAYRRGFCRQCGSPMPLLDPEQPYVVIPAGALDDDPGTRPFRHIFVGVKATWFEITDDLLQFTGHVPPEQRLPRKDT